MTIRVATNDRLAVDGVELPYVQGWSLGSEYGEPRTVTVTMTVDDRFTINGLTVAEMLGETT